MAACNILVTIPAVDFYQVLRGERQFLMIAPLAVLQQQASYFIQVGDIRWRIGTDQPCLKSASSTYICAVEGQPDLFYSIVCPPETSPNLQAKLDNILRSTTSFQDSSVAPQAAAPPTGPEVPSHTSQQVAQHMVKAGQVVAAGLVVAAQMTARGIEKGTAMVMGSTPAATEPMRPEVKTRLNRAASASGTAVHATKAAVATFATFAGVAAQMISKHVENTDTGKKLAASKDVQVLRGAAGQAAADLGHAWQHAAKLVAEKGTAASRTYIQHKYGSEQGSASASQAQFPPAYHSQADYPQAAQGSIPMQHPSTAPAGAAHAYPAGSTGAPVQGVPAAAAPLPQQLGGSFYPYIPGAPAVGTPIMPQAPNAAGYTAAP